MMNDQAYPPTWATLKGIFSKKSITQLHDLFMRIGKNIEVINDDIPNVKISIKDIFTIYFSIFIEEINKISPIISNLFNRIFNIHQSIFRYMSIKDCENLFDTAQEVHCFMANMMKKDKDGVSKIDSGQTTTESENAVVKWLNKRVRLN